MSRIVYVNGEYLPEEAAKISVFDRGFLFADAVYEVTSVLEGRLVDNRGHLARLRRSLDALRIPVPLDEDAIEAVQRTLIEHNGLENGIVYMQITRGAADRDFPYPKETTPSLVMFTQARTLIDVPAARTGIKVISVPDIRWARRDIKTVGLLAQVMAKQTGARCGVPTMPGFVQDGKVTEGSSNNAYIVNAGGRIVTRRLGNEILHGVTRATVLELSRQAQVEVEERSFTLEEAYTAREAFVTSASIFVLPVVEIDGRRIADGAPGPITRRLRTLYIEAARAGAPVPRPPPTLRIRSR